MKEVDIVLISWAKDENLREVTESAIYSLIRDYEGPSYHIYVVESNPDVNYDKYNPMKRGCTITTLHPDIPFGYHQYLNIGISEGKSKYVAICNNDLTFEPGWANAIIQVMESNPLIKSASPWCPQTQGDNKDHIGKIYSGYRVRGELAGWCIFQQRDIYETIGQLNEGVDFWFSDNIYADQLQINNIHHALVPLSVVNHHEDMIGKTGNSAIDEETKQKYMMGQQHKYQQALTSLKKN